MNETKNGSENGSVREEHPTGWLTLTKNKSAAKIVDALLDISPRREFNQKELAQQADVSRQSVANHIDLLVGIGVLDEVPNTTPQRFRFNPESEVSEAIIQLEGAMNAAASVTTKTEA